MDYPSSRPGNWITGENYTLHREIDPEPEFGPVPPRLAAATTLTVRPSVRQVPVNFTNLS